MTYEHIVQCAKCGAFGQFERGHQCVPVSYALAIVRDTLQHIGGGWECVDSRTGYRQLPIDPLCYPWWCECEYETPMNRWEIKFCDEGQSELWAEWYIPDWRAYHADREGKAITCDIQPIHGQPFATDAVRTLAVIEDYRKHMLRMAGVPSEYLTPDREGEAECTD